MRMKGFRLLLDMDGVIADFVKGALSVHRGKFDESNYAQLRGTNAWDIARWYMGPTSEFWGAFGYQFWKTLPKTPEADEIVDLCYQYVGEDRVAVLTSPVNTLGCLDGKRDWLAKHFPDLPMLLSVRSKHGKATPPKEFCATPNSILVDDYDENIRKWIDAGGLGFLYPRRWNSLFEYERRGVAELQGMLQATLHLDCFRVPPIGSGKLQSHRRHSDIGWTA
jgi:hypothetical protein